MRMMPALLAAAAIATSAAAQEKDGREQIRRLQQELQRARQDRGQLERQLAEEKKKAEEAIAQATARAAEAESAAGRERRSRVGAAAEAERLKAEIAARDAKLKDAQAAIETAQRRQSELGKTIAAREQDGAALAAKLAGEQKERAVCEDKNAKLYRYGVEVLERYRNKTAWDAIVQGEPFTGIKEVEILNVVQEYRDKLDDQRIENRPTDGGQMDVPRGPAPNR